MKNIHILLTEKPSSLFEIDGHLIINREQLIQPKYYRNIYITSDEVIKIGDYYLSLGVVFKCNALLLSDTLSKKIILTDNQDLINDGVQAIDDEFLEWFVANPSCELVEVVKEKQHIGEEVDKSYPKGFFDYKIIIPKEEPKQDCKHDIVIKYGVAECQNCGMEENEIVKEEPKQETLEEVAVKYSERHQDVSGNLGKYLVSSVFQDGAKWQQERMYSEEDMISFAWFLVENLGQYSCDRTAHFEGKYLEQFKKK